MNRLRILKKELKELEKSKPTLSKYKITKQQVELSKRKSEKESRVRANFRFYFTNILTLITLWLLYSDFLQMFFADFLSAINYVLSNPYELYQFVFLSIIFFASYFWLSGTMASELFPIKDDETISIYNEYLNDRLEYSSSIEKKKDEVEDYKNRLKQIEKQKKRDYWIEQDGYEFERSIAHLFAGLGYYVELTNKTGDEGVDMFLNNNTVVQCKATKSSVSPSVVRDLYGTMKHFKAQKGILVSTGGFTSGSIDFAMGKNIELWDMDKILSVSKGIELTE